MPMYPYEILWQGVRFRVGATSPHDAQARVMAQLAAEGIVANAWQMREAHRIDRKADSLTEDANEQENSS